MGGKQLTLLLACELEILSLGISCYLENNTQVSKIHKTSKLQGVYSLVTNHPIDVAYIELDLLKSSGLSTIKDILKASPRLRIIILARHEMEPFISKCMEFGALGYVSLRCQPKELLEAMNAVSNNTKYLSQNVAYHFAISNLDKNQQIFSLLTTREYEVFTKLAQGSSVTDIAKNIHLSPKTVQVHRANIMSKLDIKNIAELILLALKHGVISLDDTDT